MISVSLSLPRRVAIVVLICAMGTGCRATTVSGGSLRSSAEARWSFVKFNLRAPLGPQAALDSICGGEACGKDRAPACDRNCDEVTGCDACSEVGCDHMASSRPSSNLYQALRLVAKSSAELDQMLHCHSAPALADIEGPWNGINKGVATALLGVTQDTKVFQACDCGADRAGCGYNIQVQQVSLCDLDQLGFRPRIDRHTGRAATMGNFVIRPVTNDRAPLILDYTAADNRPLDPSRKLVDELVMIQPTLMLGRAHVKIGSLQVPIAYFVLYRD